MSRRAPHWIVPLFFCSGFSGLLYEILWVRQLTTLVGGSAFSVSIVLTVFMGGLALGSALASRFADRIEQNAQLVLIYGLLELAIGVYGLLFTSLASLLRPFYGFLYSGLHTSFLIYNLLSGLLSIILLMLPTTLMGATLPLLCRYYIRGRERAGARTGGLYGLNTAGGALGSLAAGFFLVRYFGVSGTLWIAVAVNLLIGLLCLLVSYRVRAFKKVHLASPPAESASAVLRAHKEVFIILLVSGFCAMGCEVIWTKLVALLAGPTTYSFTVVLFTFIIGLALGSIVFGRLSDRVGQPLQLLILTQILAALGILAVSQILGHAQLYFSALLYRFQDNFFHAEWSKAASLFLFMVMPTLCLGAAFPVGVKILCLRSEKVGRAAGALYTFNTVGALFGALAAGFLMVPLFGKSSSLALLVSVQLAGAAAVVILGRRRMKYPVLWLILCLLPLALLLFWPRWDAASFIRGRYHRFSSFEPVLKNLSLTRALFNASRIRGVFEKDRVLYQDDGIGGFVAVCQTVNTLGAESRYLSSSGKMEASTQGDLSTMTLLAHVPMMLHPSPRSALVIGLGSGITAGEMLHHPLQRVDVVEISPEVVEGSAYFRAWNNDFAADPRCRVIVQDARTHMTLSKRQYDVITAEPSNIWMSGLAHLFTLEYFEKTRDHLKENGIFVQWFHGYQADWSVFATVGRTFRRVFPNSLLMRSSLSGGDYLFIGFKHPQAGMTPDALRRNFEYTAGSSNMRMRHPFVLIPLIVAENLDELFGEGPLHSDAHPVLEYLAPLQLYCEKVSFEHQLDRRARVSSELRRMAAQFRDPKNRLILADFLASLNNPPFDLIDLEGLDPALHDAALSIVRSFCEKNIHPYPQIRDSVLVQHCLAVQQHRYLQHLNRLADRPSVLRGRVYYDLAKLFSYRGEPKQALVHLLRALEDLPNDYSVLVNLAYTSSQLNDFDRAMAACDRLLELYPRSYEIYDEIASIQLRMNNPAGALKALETAAGHLPFDGRRALTVLGLYLQKGDIDSAVRIGEQTAAALPGAAAPIYRQLAVALLRSGDRTGADQYIKAGLAIAPQDTVLQRLYAKTRGRPDGITP